MAQTYRDANNGTSTGVPGTIVKRNAFGNFSANMITLDGTPANSTDAVTKAYVDSALLQMVHRLLIFMWLAPIAGIDFTVNNVTNLALISSN